MAENRIMIVEDDFIISSHIKSTLSGLGYDVTYQVSTGEEAIKRAEEDSPDLVLMDIKLEGEMDGIEAAGQIRARFNIPVVFLTAFSDNKILDRAKITEPYGYIMKPFEDRELHSNIEIALYKHRIEKELKESKEWLSITLQSIGDAVIATNSEDKITFMNPVAETLTGWKKKNAIEKTLKNVFHVINEENGKLVEDSITEIIQSSATMSRLNHTLLVTTDSTKIPIDISGAPIKDDKGKIVGVVLVFRDVSDRKMAEERLKASLKEKEVLIKEIHHRVKSNMQLIHSLLNIQSAQIKNKAVLHFIKELQNRIRSMALIHENLYHSKDLAKISFADCIRELTSGLFRSYGVDSDSIKLKEDVNNILLDVNTAIPCGLIVNELVSNSLKHAFPDDFKRGDNSKYEIQIKMKPGENGKQTLIVGDNGVGFPEDLDIHHTESLDLQLINAFVNQLEGEIQLDRTNGTTFEITFDKPENLSEQIKQ